MSSIQNRTTPIAPGSLDAPVSVVIPTYNRCDSVVIAIESVLAQTVQPAQIIIVDDGSDDDTAATISARFDQVQLLKQNNHGVSHARNQGIKASTQPWIAFLDSDDRWLPNKLDVQLQAINSTPNTVLCHCDEHWIRNGKRVNPMNKHKKRGGDIFEHCLPLCAISPSATLILRSLFDSIGLFDESMPACEDYDLWLRICAHHPVLFVNQALLEKTGGHNDQLSRKHWGMDRFRLHALAKLWHSSSLSEHQASLVLSTLKSKYDIIVNGATKRDNQPFIVELRSLYADLVDLADQ